VTEIFRDFLQFFQANIGIVLYFTIMPRRFLPHPFQSIIDLVTEEALLNKIQRNMQTSEGKLECWKIDKIASNKSAHNLLLFWTESSSE
jgi:hypothetical protein